MARIALLLAIIAPFLLGSGPYITANGEPQVEGPVTVYGLLHQILDGILVDTVNTTTGDLTLYVRLTGLDTNDCLSVAKACLTIQEAVERVPKKVRNAVLVDVGAGNFAGFFLGGFSIEHPSGSLRVQGVYKAATVATGTNSGTSTSGTTLKLTDAGQGWTVNDLRSKLVKVNSEYRYILSNTATEINFVGAFTATTNLKVYEIVEHASILTSITTGAVYGMIEAIGNISTGNSLNKVFSVDGFQINGQGGWYETVWNWEGQALSISHIHGFDNYWGIGFEHTQGRCTVEDIWLEDGGNSYPMFYYNFNDQLIISRIMAEDSASIGLRFHGCNEVRGNYIYTNSSATYGLVIQDVGLTTIDGLFCTNNTSIGLFVYHSDVVEFTNATLTGNNIGAVASGCNHFDFDAGMVITGNTSHGIVAEVGTKFVDLDIGTISNNGGFGIYVDENSTGNRTAGSFLNMQGTITVEGNTLGGIALNNNSGAALTNVDGINTGAYGLTLEMGSYAIITSDTGITGASGNATVNGGTTTLTWATDFVSNNDKVVNLDNGCRIERKD